MIQRIGATVNTETGEIEYKTDLPEIYQGSSSSYWLDIDFYPALEDINSVFITFRRSDGATTANLSMSSVDGKVWSKQLNSDWYFYKPGQLKYTITSTKILEDVNVKLASSYAYLSIIPTIGFNQPAPLPPNDYEEIINDISDIEEDVTSLDNRVDDLDTPITGRVPILESEVSTLQSDVNNLEDANMIKSLADKGTATTSSITIEATHYDGTTSDIIVNLAGDMATEQEVDAKISNYNTNTIQPKLNQIDTELDKKVEYTNIEETTEPTLEVNSAKNVTLFIAGNSIQDIFESNGTTVKNATNATNAINSTNAEKATKDASGNTITSTYAKLSECLTKANQSSVYPALVGLNTSNEQVTYNFQLNDISDPASGGSSIEVTNNGYLYIQPMYIILQNVPISVDANSITTLSLSPSDYNDLYHITGRVVSVICDNKSIAMLYTGYGNHKENFVLINGSSLAISENTRIIISFFPSYS